MTQENYQLKDIQNSLQSEMGALLYFSGETCGVCHALHPKCKAIFDEHFPQLRQIYIDAHTHPEIAAHFQVFSVPTLIVFLKGREFVREGRTVSLHRMTEQLLRPYCLMIE